MLEKDQVKKIAISARIELSEEQIEKFQGNLSTIFEYIHVLNEVDVSGVEEVTQVTGLINVQRQDVPEKSEIIEEIKSQAPEIKDGYFKVKAIL